MFKWWEEFLIDGDHMKFLKNVINRLQPSNFKNNTHFTFLNFLHF
jgi:hypothetical protein